MRITKEQRSSVKDKYEGKCAYTGTELLDDWQVDHIEPLRRNWWENSAINEENHNAENMIPAQRLINHYKHSKNLEQFRSFMMEFHLRLKRQPKNPKSEKSIKTKGYMTDIAGLFGISEDKPFTGYFYFERLEMLKQIAERRTTNSQWLHLDEADWGLCLDVMGEHGSYFCRLCIYNDEPCTAYLDSLSVHKNLRNKGIATRLQELRESIGKEVGCTHSTLMVKKGSWMKAWYERRGYNEIQDADDGYSWMTKIL